MPGITPLFPCNVECVSSTKYGERPTVIVFEEKRLPVAEVIKQWRSPEGTYFQVVTDNNLAFELAYQDGSDQWICKLI